MPHDPRRTPASSSPSSPSHDGPAELRIDRQRKQPSIHCPATTGGVFCFWGQMDFTKLDGLVPAVIQDAESGEVLMVGFMNDTALATTQETGFATFYSRSRKKLWTKG